MIDGEINNCILHLEYIWKLYSDSVLGLRLSDSFTWAKHYKSCRLNQPITTLIAITIATATDKQLLDEVFVISGIIKVEGSVISGSQRLRLITLTETSIIPDITKTESNNCFIILRFKENNDKRIIALPHKKISTLGLIPFFRVAPGYFSL